MTLNSVFEHVNRHGPLVVERTTCPHCGYMEFHVHAFCESLQCCQCQKRTASAVPMYKVDDQWDKPKRKEPGLKMVLKVYEEDNGVRLSPKFKGPTTLSLIGAVSAGMAKLGRTLAAQKGYSDDTANKMMFGEE